MQATIDTSDYYTFEEAAHALGFSLAHVYRAVSYDVFHPVRLGKGARKHLLKSEVDAKIGQPLYSRRKTKQHDMDNPGIPVQSSPQMGAFLSSMNELVPIIAHGYSQAVTAPVVASFAHTLDTIISALLGKDNPSINPAMLQQFRQETERVYQNGLQTMIAGNFSKESIEEAVRENTPVDPDLQEQTASLMNNLVRRGEQKQAAIPSGERQS